jgi:hypothetical protein
MDAVASMLYLDYGRQGQGAPRNIYSGNKNLDSVEFLKHLNSQFHKRFPGTLLIAEESTAWPNITSSVEDDGLGFDLKWNMGWMNDFLSYMQVDPLFRKGSYNQLTFSMLYNYSEDFMLVFSHDEVQNKVHKAWIPLMVASVISGVILIITTWGENNTSPEYMGAPLNCLYGWLMCLAMIGWFNARYDCTNSFSQYMTRTSYGLYIVHYLVVASLGYMMKTYTQLSPVAIYLILTVAVFTLSPLIYEVLHRIPFIRWCVFGEKKSDRNKSVVH